MAGCCIFRVHHILFKKPSIIQYFKRLISQTMAQRNQLTNRVMLIKPSCFNYNPQTAESNDFQAQIEGMSDGQVQEAAVKEFEALVSKLKSINVSVNVFEDTIRASPDAVFPNNWVSFHSEASSQAEMVIYPMLSDSRRKERNPEIVQYWTESLGTTVVDLTHYENNRKFLEGTGSMTLDRVNKIAYACYSQRTHEDVLGAFCKKMGYSPVTFHSVLSPQNDGHFQDVYHTNVIMSVGDGFAVVCLESIRDDRERENVVRSLESTNKEVVDITGQQVNDFAGNVLQLAGTDGHKHLMMSTRAYSSFTHGQLAVFHRHCDSVVPVPLNVIERAGGGGVRCMIAEIFPPISHNKTL